MHFSSSASLWSLTPNALNALQIPRLPSIPICLCHNPRESISRQVLDAFLKALMTGPVLKRGTALRFEFEKAGASDLGLPGSRGSVLSSGLGMALEA